MFSSSCDWLMMNEVENSDTFRKREKKWSDNFFVLMRKRNKKRMMTAKKTIYNQLNLKYVCDKRHNVTLMYGTVLKKLSPVRQVHAFEQFCQWNIDNRIVVGLCVWRNNTVANLIAWQQSHIRTPIQLNNGRTTLIRFGHWQLRVLVILCFGFKMWHHKMTRMNDLLFLLLFCVGSVSAAEIP